jgi:predicted acylesterase/phospholipase RssA
MNWKTSSYKALAVGVILFLGSVFLPEKSVADSGFVLEKGKPFALNLDISQGLAFTNDSPYRLSGKLAPEFQIGDFGLGAFGNLRFTNPNWDLGPGIRADWMFLKLLTDTGLKLTADGTYWPDANNCTLEGGVVCDISGIYRLGLMGGHDFQQNDSTLMLSAGCDLLTVFNLAPNPPEPNFQVQPAAPVTNTGNSNPGTSLPQKTRKVALVISGGGSTGAWAVGALQVLEEYFKQKNIDIFMVCGTSTGSLISSMMGTNDPTEKEANLKTLTTIYSTISTKDVFDLYSPSDMLKSDAVFSTSPLQKTIGSWMNSRWEKIQNSNVYTVIATADMLSNKTVYYYAGPKDDLVTVDPMKVLRNKIEKDNNRSEKWASVADPHLAVSRIPDQDTLMRAMLASSSDPVLFPLTHIPKGPNAQDQYADGGVLDFIPLEIAFANGADDVYSIALSPSFPDPVTVQCKDLVSTLMQTIDVFANRVDIADTQEAEDYVDSWNAVHPNNHKHLYFIRPPHKIQGDSNVFDPVQMKAWMAQGTSVATTIVQKWDKYNKMSEVEYQKIPWDKR